MKMSKILSLILVVVMLFSMTACSLDSIKGMIEGIIGGEQPDPDPTPDPDPKPEPEPEVNPLAGTYDITMWVSELPGVADLFQQQIDAFEAANPGIVINATIDGVTEADAASQVIGDILTAPDMYCFAQDQLARLVQAAALLAPNETVANRLRTANDSVSVAAASVAGQMYAYPMTSDNGYYLYYDTSIISDPTSLEAIIADCEANDVEFHFALENAWYTASFFFATGCHSNWTTDPTGKFTGIDDTFNSPEGLIAMKGMQKLAQSPKYVSDADSFANVGAIVTGIWHANSAAEHFGANLGATKLPSFTVDGQSYQLGSYSGNKLLGVKPQADGKKGLVLSLLAEYLTNEECQLQRYELAQWGPSNLAAQQNESVKSNISLNALAAQNEHAVPQGNISGAWWDIAKVLGADAKAATSDADLQAALDVYDEKIAASLTLSDEERLAWSVIGSICGTSWDTDLPMAKVSDNVYESEVLTLNAGEEFKVRQGASWDVNFGSDGKIGGPNCVVEVSGKYVVRLTIHSATSATIELIAQ